MNPPGRKIKCGIFINVHPDKLKFTNLKNVLILAINIIVCCTLFAQDLSRKSEKPPIDTSVFKKWAGLGSEAISNDGNYVSYTIYNQPPGSHRLVIQSTNGNWKKEFPVASTTNFTNDSRLVIFKIGTDSLCILTLGKEDIALVPHVSEYNLPKDDKGEWLAYQQTTPEKVLVLRNLITGIEQHFSSVSDYKVSDNNNWLVYQLTTPEKELVLRNLITGSERHFSSVTNYVFDVSGKELLLEIRNDSARQSVLRWFDLSTGEIRDVWANADRNEKTGNYVFDTKANQLSFIVEKKNDDHSIYELWYYKKGMDSAVMLVNNRAAGIEQGLVLANRSPLFSKDGNQIFFELEESETVKIEAHKPKPDAVQADVWSYRDKELHSIQLAAAKYNNEGS